MEKPVIFTYEEIFSSTDGFSDSCLLGHGRYGSVYYGLLRDQVCSFLPGSFELYILLYRYTVYVNAYEYYIKFWTSFMVTDIWFYDLTSL